MIFLASIQEKINEKINARFQFYSIILGWYGLSIFVYGIERHRTYQSFHAYYIYNILIVLVYFVQEAKTKVFYVLNPCF